MAQTGEEANLAVIFKITAKTAKITAMKKRLK